MINNVCQAVSNLDPQTLALPTVILAGLADGVNPCAIGMLIFLLGYLVVFAGKPERILKTGLVYITIVFLTYLLIGLFFYSTLEALLISPRFESAAAILRRVLGAALIVAGLINIKDYFWWGRGVSLEIPQKTRPWLQKLVERVSLPATVVLAFAVTILETPCSFPLYAGTVGILSQCNFSSLKLLSYFLLYNFLFVLPLIIIWILLFSNPRIAPPLAEDEAEEKRRPDPSAGNPEPPRSGRTSYKGVEIVHLKEWEHRNRRKMRLLMGVVLVILGTWLAISG